MKRSGSSPVTATASLADVQKAGNCRPVALQLEDHAGNVGGHALIALLAFLERVFGARLAVLS